MPSSARASTAIAPSYLYNFVTGGRVPPLEPLPDRRCHTVMDQNREKQALETKLARCHELAKEFPDGSIAQMIRDLEDELRQQIRELERR